MSTGASDKVCPNCHNEAICRSRSFSKNSQAFLILSNELDPQAIDKSICDECYLDLRSFLIDNSHELESEMDTLKNKKYQKIKEKLNKIAG